MSSKANRKRFGPFYVYRMFHAYYDGPFKSLVEAADFIKAELKRDTYWDYDGVAILNSPDQDPSSFLGREKWAHLVYSEKETEDMSTKDALRMGDIALDLQEENAALRPRVAKLEAWFKLYSESDEGEQQTRLAEAERLLGRFADALARHVLAEEGRPAPWEKISMYQTADGMLLDKARGFLAAGDTAKQACSDYEPCTPGDMCSKHAKQGER